MADRGEIDRLALREYKRLNGERLGLSQTYDLSLPLKIEYLHRFADWLDRELLRMETSPVLPSERNSHIPPSVRFRSGEPSSRLTDEAVFSAIESLLTQHGRFLLLGNGGSGKTVTLLSWLRHKCDIAQEQGSEHVPVFVSLHLLTPRMTLISLLRSAFGKHGVSLTIEQAEALLHFGRVCIAFDGLNEIHYKAVDEGALENVISFLHAYPDSHFVVTSRYMTSIKQWDLPTIEMDNWDEQRIRSYLDSRLGSTLGNQTYASIGDTLDFEWMRGCSVAGLCSNPLTLWMLATVVEDKQSPPSRHEEVVDSLVELMVRRTKETKRRHIMPRVLKKTLEDFAYLMVGRGDVLSTGYEDAIELCALVIRERNTSGLLPAGLDSYQLLSALLATGLLRQTDDERVEWLHQVLQERLSVLSSERWFSQFMKLTRVVECPVCSYQPGEFFEAGRKLWGKCDETEDCSTFEIPLPEIPPLYILRDKVVLIDHTGAPRQPGMTSYPTSFIDERWMALTPGKASVFWLALMYAQDNEVNQPIPRSLLEGGEPSKLVDLEVWTLIEAGFFRLEQEEDITNVHIYTPPVNPSMRISGYKLVVLRDLSPDELEEDPEHRIGITSEEKEKYLEERRRKNLPIYYNYDFVEDEKRKVFRLAQKFGGQVLRTWGPYEEVIAEFPGEAWDFSKYNTDQDAQLEMEAERN